MVLIVIQVWYPIWLAPEVGKKYLEVRKEFPDDRSLMKPIVRSAVKVTKKGLHVIAISSVKEGKFKEAFDYTLKQMLMFSVFKEYKYSVDVYYDVTEALPLIGLEEPAE